MLRSRLSRHIWSEHSLLYLGMLAQTYRKRRSRFASYHNQATPLPHMFLRLFVSCVFVAGQRAHMCSCTPRLSDVPTVLRCRLCSLGDIMPSRCMPTCQSYSRKKMPRLSFHDIPSDANERERWLKVTSRKHWVPNSTYWCSTVSSRISFQRTIRKAAK